MSLQNEVNVLEEKVEQAAHCRFTLDEEHEPTRVAICKGNLRRMREYGWWPSVLSSNREQLVVCKTLMTTSLQITSL